MVDRPPPQRFRIIERGGRLEVVDLTTGARPPSAAERMAAHDAAHGHAALRYDRLTEAAENNPIVAVDPGGSTAAEPMAQRQAPANATPESGYRSPWSGRARAQLGAQTEAEAQARPSPQAKQAAKAKQRDPGREGSGKGRSQQKLIVTSKWWDSKGPRTINLGEAGRAKLANGFMTTLIIGFFIAMAMLVLQPLLLLVSAFALFRFGGVLFGPLGARLIDQAMLADGAPR